MTEQTTYIVIKFIPMDKNLVLYKFTVSCHQARLGQPTGSKVPKVADGQVAAERPLQDFSSAQACEPVDTAKVSAMSTRCAVLPFFC